MVLSSNLTVLINGGTSEVGRELTRIFAKNGHDVIISSNNSEQSFEVQKEIFDELGIRVDMYIADFASEQEIKEMSEDIENKYPELNLIINNLSITSSEPLLSEDEIEIVFQTNYLSRFLLTNLLIPTLKTNKDARILDIVGDVSNKVSINFENVNLDEIYSDDDAETQADLADIMYIQTLSEKLINTKITANSINPGKIVSEIHRQNAAINPFGMLWQQITHQVDSWTSTSPEKVAQLVYKIAMNDALKVSGKHFIKGKPAKLPAFAAKRSNRDRLWALSNELTESTFDIF